MKMRKPQSQTCSCNILLQVFIGIFLLWSASSSPTIESLLGSYSNENYPARMSKCLARVSVPHFMTSHYTLPGSELHDAEECEDANVPAATRTTLSREDSDFRLPKSLKPTHYALEMCPNLQDPFDFSGSVVIDLQVLENTDNITLNIMDLTITGVHVWEVTDEPIENVKYDANSLHGIHREAEKYSREFLLDYELMTEIFEGLETNESGIKMAQYYNETENKYDFLQYLKDLLLETLPKKENEVEAPIIENEVTDSSLTITKTEIETYLQKITFFTQKQLLIGRNYKIKLTFEGKLNEELIGFYKTFYMDENGVKRISAVTQFQVSEARRAFPCFDEPGFKATFGISLCREQSMTTLSNMPKISTYPRDGFPGMVWDVFDTTVPMSTYLVAFAVTDFVSRTCLNSEIPFQVWVPRPVVNHTDYACDVSPRLLQFFQDYFDVPFPLPKMDLIGLPHFFALGMENWGLITFIANRVVVQDPTVNLLDSRNALETISHEIAHQWFGNLVTPHWWSDIWLNEGFATYLSILGSDHIFPGWDKMKGDIVDIQQKVLVKDSFESSHPVVMDVNNPREYVAIFDEISYGKGCFLIRMLVHVLTEKTFRNGLQNFLRKYKYMSARQEDLWSILTVTGHNDGTLPKDMQVAEIMKNWIYQEGYPVVYIARIGKGRGVAGQKRYYFEVDEGEAAFRSQMDNQTEVPMWWVPISFTSRKALDMGATNPKYWLRSDTEQILLTGMPPPDEWFLVNMQQTGFYRVNYEVENWQLLVQQLYDDHLVFDDMTRTQIVDDAFTLAYSNQLTYTIPLSMIDYLQKETSHYVIKAAVDNISPLLEAFSHDAIYGNFKELILDSFVNHIPLVSFNQDQNDLPFIKSTKNFIVQHFCKISEPCIQEAKQLFQTWTRHKANYSFVEPDLLGTVFCVVIAEGGETEWNILMREANSGRYPDKMGDLVNALSCTKEKWLLSKLLSKLTFARGSEHTIDIGSLPLALNAVAQNPVGIDVAWEFMKTIWPTVADNFYGDILLEAVIPHVRSQYHYQDVLGFIQDMLTKKQKLDYQLKYISEVTENIKRKISFYTRNYDTFVNWFEEREEKLKSTYLYRNRSRRRRPRYFPL